MNRIKNFEVILDADDVLIDCNAYALSLLSARNKKDYDLNHVTGWGLLGIPEDERLSFLSERRFYETQPALPGAAAFLRELMNIASVTIMTAVYPQFMGERIRRLRELFPFFPLENIIMGHRKEMLHADVMLDDGVHNLLPSPATLPVLFRQPWNRSVSGICCVNSYSDFLSLVNIMQGNRTDADRVPKVVCIVGPSGSGKHQLADALAKRPDFEGIRTCTTSSCDSKNRHLSASQFEQYSQSDYFLETTYYCGERYALPKKEIDSALGSGKNAVAVMDISGCMAVHNHYPGQAKILYVDRDKRSCISSILYKTGMDHEQQTDRILSIDLEQKNKILADYIIPFPSGQDLSETVDFIASAIAGTDELQ